MAENLNNELGKSPALSSYLDELQLEEKDDQSALGSFMRQANLGMESQINDIRAAQGAGGYDLPLDYLESLPSGARLLTLKLHQERSAAADEGEVRRNYYAQQQQAIGSTAQRASDRRMKLHKLLEFQNTPLDVLRADNDLNTAGVPQLENLRSDFLMDPATLSVKQVSKTLTPDQADLVRDEEVADYFGIPREVVTERRNLEAAAKHGAQIKAANEKYEQDSHAHTYQTWKREAQNWQEQEKAHQAEQMAKLKTTAAGLDESQWRYVIANPQAFADQPYTREAAHLAEIMDSAKKQAHTLKNEEGLQKFLFGQLFQKQINSTEGAIAQFGPGGTTGFMSKLKYNDLLSLSKDLAHSAYKDVLAAQADEAKDRADAVSAVSAVDAALNTAPTVRGVPAPTAPNVNSANFDMGSFGGPSEAQRLSSMASPERAAKQKARNEKVAFTTGAMLGTADPGDATFPPDAPAPKRAQRKDERKLGGKTAPQRLGKGNGVREDEPAQEPSLAQYLYEEQGRKRRQEFVDGLKYLFGR